MRSDHLVEVVDAGVSEPDTPFLVMELLVGEDLAAHSESCGPLATETVVTLLRQVASGLDKVHAEGVVHRDLKPENLFLTRRDDGSEQVKILDFGVAKLLDRSGDLHTTRSLGTPLYMAPEQMTGEGSLGLHADLYALAHVAFSLLVGSPYWQHEARAAANGYAFMNVVLKGAVEPASERAARYGAELPAAFDPWFSRATALSPAQRFSSAGEQIAALAESLAVAPQAKTVAVRPRIAAAKAVVAVPGAAAIPAPAAIPAASFDSNAVASADTVASFSSSTFATSPTTPIDVRPTTVTPVREAPLRLRWIAIGGGLATVGLVLALAIPSTRPNTEGRGAVEPAAVTPSSSASSSAAASGLASAAASASASAPASASASSASTAARAAGAASATVTPSAANAAGAAVTPSAASTSTAGPAHKGDPLDAY